MNIEQYIKNNSLNIIVKPSSSANKITGWDETRAALRVDIKAAPEKDKANKEVIRFFSKLLKKKVRIAKGLRSKEKVIAF